MKFETFNIRGKFVEVSMRILKIAKVMTGKGELWYPTEIEQVLVDTVMKLGSVQTHKCQVQEFVPNITDIPSETFRVTFPDGTMINDKVASLRYVK